MLGHLFCRQAWYVQFPTTKAKYNPGKTCRKYGCKIGSNLMKRKDGMMEDRNIGLKK